MRVALSSPDFVVRPPRKVSSLVEAMYEANDLHAPRLVYIAREVQLAEGNAQLCGPPGAVDLRFAFRDGIPRWIASAVSLCARRIEKEIVSGAMIVIAVERDLEDVTIGFAEGIPPQQSCYDSLPAHRVKHPRSDVDGLIVVRESHFG